MATASEAGVPRIVYLVHAHQQLDRGGAQKHALELHEAVQASGAFESHLIARTVDPAQHHAGTPFAAFDRDDPHQMLAYTGAYDHFFQTLVDRQFYIRNLPDLLRSLQPDVIHFQHFMGFGMPALHAIRRALPDVRIVMTFHEMIGICNRNGQMLTTAGELCRAASPTACNQCFPHIHEAQFFLRERYVKAAFDLVDRFITPSRFLRGRYIDWGVPEDRIVFRRLGRPPQPVAPVRSVEPGGRRSCFGFFGQVTRFKGLDVLLRAVAEIRNRGIDDIEVHVHPGNLDRIDNAEVRAEIDERIADLADCVTVHPPYHADDLPALMAAVDSVVVPSIWWENSPLVIQEAFHHHRPVIASDIGGMAEKVTDGVDGLHFRVGDAKQLADAMIRAMDPQLWEKLQAGIQTPPSIDACRDEHLELYRELLGTDRPPPGPPPEPAPPAGRTKADDATALLYLVHAHPAIQRGGAQKHALELYEAAQSRPSLDPFFVAAAEGRRAPHAGAMFSTVDGDPSQLLFHPHSYDGLFHRQNGDAWHRSFRNLVRWVKPGLVHIQHFWMIGFPVIPLIRRLLPDRAPIVMTLHELMSICHNRGQMVTTDGELCTSATPSACNRCFPEIATDRFFLRERFIKAALDGVDRFVSPSEFLRDRYVSWGLPEEKTTVIEYGRAPSPAAPTRELSDGGRRTRFAFFAQVTPFKGLEVLLKAARILVGRGMDDVHVDVWPGNLDGIDWRAAEVEELRSELGDRVKVHGPYSRDELPDLVAQIDTVVVPSTWWENSPLVIQEAFQHRRPVLCSNIGGMREKVTDEVDGLHFRVGDPKSLADCMERVMAPAEWDRLQAGIRPVFTIEESMDAHMELYSRLLAER